MAKNNARQKTVVHRRRPKLATDTIPVSNSSRTKRLLAIEMLKKKETPVSHNHERRAKAPAKPAPISDIEPTAEELAAEQSIIDEELEGRRDRQTIAAGKDLLASYMEQLSHIPLFSPEQEMNNARMLQDLEYKTWNLVLSSPRALVHVCIESASLEPPVQQKLDKLLQNVRRAALRSKRRELKNSPLRDKLVESAIRSMRFADYDKEMLERVIRRCRREVWGRRVLDTNPAFRLTHAKLAEIEQAHGASIRARNNFVRANLRLVVSVARNFHHHRIPFIDLIQEGNVGLMKAVHRFDHERGFRFSTYAHWWIRQSIERAIINKGSQVRLPVHVIDSRRQVGRAATKLQQKLGRAPTAGELSRSLRIPQIKVEQILNGVQQDPVSLDEPVGGDDPRKYLDLVRDDTNPGLDEAVIRENTHERVRELLHMLNPIEKDIIRRRFGLGDDSDQTLDEIGKIYNLSRERVRQIQAQGLMKMRRMCERRKIS
ncbi:MAG: sigma-70 family RNA polymerase sigma factor [Deltaproteobacteria bacterium]|nr:sigma-70 family RNA polymerase sigma factor [Deltaproteobacteria bacterium]